MEGERTTKDIATELWERCRRHTREWYASSLRTCPDAVIIPRPIHERLVEEYGTFGTFNGLVVEVREGGPGEGITIERRALPPEG